MAATVQYDAAREPARQLGVDVRPEPFTARQQRQSRMGGGEEDDGTEREHVELAPPVLQPHLERERRVAAAMSQEPGELHVAVAVPLSSPGAVQRAVSESEGEAAARAAEVLERAEAILSLLPHGAITKPVQTLNVGTQVDSGRLARRRA